MKKYFGAVALIALGHLSLNAQLKVVHYEMEGINTYSLQGFIPSSSAAFYSEKGGGKQLMDMPVGPDGNLLLSAEHSFKPAFVLNADSKEREGSKKVLFIQDKEFVLDNLVWKGKKLSYQVSGSRPGAYRLEVLRSEKGAPYNSVQSFLVYNETKQDYTYTEQSAGEFSYRIKISAVDGNFEAFSRTLSASIHEAVVYPNPCTDRLHLALDKEWNIFVVRNSLGQVSKKGKLSELLNGWINMSDLQPGAYSIEILSGNTSIGTTSFLKQ